MIVSKFIAMEVRGLRSMSIFFFAAHTTQFTEIGWRYLQHGHGVGLLDGGGSYVSLASPQGDHLLTVIETMVGTIL